MSNPCIADRVRAVKMLRVRSYLLPRLSRATGRPAGSARRPSCLLPVQRARVVDGFRGRGSRRQPAGRRGRGVGDRGHGGRWPARCGAAAWAAHRLARRTTVRVGDPADTVPHRARNAFPALPGRRVRQRLTPTNGDDHPTEASRAAHRCWAAQPCRGEAPHRPTAPGARQHPGCAPGCGDDRDRRRTPVVVCRPCGPASQAAPDPYQTGSITRPEPAMQRTGAGPPNLVGARRRIARPRQGRGNIRVARQDAAMIATDVARRWWSAGPAGPAGQAAPDPYQRGRSPDRSRPCSALVLNRPTL
jgi:hypothetical protein